MPAAKKQASESTAVSTEVLKPLSSLSHGSLAASLGSDLLDKLGADAKEAAATERPAVGSFSLRGGILAYGGEAVAGNQMECVVIAKVWENTFYAGDFNPNMIVNPHCFALSAIEPGELDGGTMVSSPINDDLYEDEKLVSEGTRQSDTCRGCPQNEWGSDPKGGRGKACKEKRRLVLMPADALQSVESVMKAELATLTIPVMSVANWASYANQLSATVGLPVHAVTTNIKPVPDPRSQFKVTFEGVNAIANPAILAAVEARIEEAQRIGLTSYGRYEAPPAPVAQAGRKKY